MAQRYGGRFSPGGRPKGRGNEGPDGGSEHHVNQEFRGKRRSRAGGRVNILFFLPLPLAIRIFNGDAEFMPNIVALLLFMLGAWLTREGVKAQEAFDERRVAKKPAFPRKIFAAVALAIALFITGLANAETIMTPIFFAAAGLVLHLLAFGPDPLKDKGVAGIDQFQQDRVATAVDAAEAHLKSMKDAIKRAHDFDLERRVESFAGTAREMFRTIEEDPRDLASARKYLSVYLQGASDATAKFADLYGRNQDPSVRADYEALLDDLQTNFAARTDKMLLDDRTDMDIEIKVLRDRLSREGLTID
ncbi:MAG: 5-bromo-4-chloroindolyl phosphate hydrolysis family protein [Pseudomonadota bacterium]